MKLVKLDCVLGVDGGGTKTFVQIADFGGKILAESQSGSGNYKSVGTDISIRNIESAVADAICKAGFTDNIKFGGACFGLSGLDSPSDERIYKDLINKSYFSKYLTSNIIICNDSKIGLYAGLRSQNGIMIICGTGSNCYGINEEGKEAKANGWDYILGDEGSGFSIGVKALRAVMRFSDGRGKKTLLLKNILNELNFNEINSLVKWVYNRPFTTGKIAGLAKVVCKTAALGDEVSINILSEEANEAFISICTVAEKLGLEKKEFDLVFVGSVFKCKKYFKKVLEEKLWNEFPDINLIPLTEKPVTGAVKLALTLQL
ncbi:MAG: BadF/BadG/BcrA/BcrD ATPase family protein [Candidatus Humimicrobiaceae bacterium]